MAFTEEQMTAINLDGTNIIVSAGAGSGKTAVLTERVKRKVLGGVHVNELLVLTFTNAAAAEMKDRIRKVIAATPSLKDEMNLIDGAYITTFDSFSLSVVKKYSTRLNITNNPVITDEVIIDLCKNQILDEIFDEKYKSPSKSFLSLINDFCYKEDKSLKGLILKAYKKIELKYDKTEFLNNYFNIFNEEKINLFIDQYVDLIKEKQNTVKSLLNDAESYFDGDFMTKMYDYYSKFLNAKTYDEFLISIDGRGPVAPRGSSDEGKRIKSAISDTIKDAKKYFIYESVDEIRKELIDSSNNTKEIIDIITLLDRRLEDYKMSHNMFSFNDISRLAIKVVLENEDIRRELKYSFNEIMIDEYQDTSDTQEMFISLIANNNVYMVGDIKQSIYRFRNANPAIFKNKYDLYSNTDKGEKIDLLKNFRSRDEVLSDINLLFDDVMDNEFGGADYQVSHRMIFGNQDYVNKGKTEQDYHMEFLTYDKESLGNITPAMQEAFIIADDINNKIKNKYQVFDKKTGSLRDCKYSDFVILIDKSSSFDLFKKVFEYNKIPLSILKEESFKKDNDAYIFKNLLKLIICISKNDFGEDFKYAFVSLSRSYLYKISDNEIYNYIINGNYKESDLYKDLEEISREVNYCTPSSLIRKAITKVEYDLKLLNINNIKANRIRCEYFYNLIKDYEVSGKTIYDFIDYLDNIFTGDYDLKFNINSDVADSCKIMTIHKSKGLEYPVCYFTLLFNKFNFKELKDRIIFDNEYGLIMPYVNEYYKDTILKILLKNRTKKEEISEKIRLFYVATTRAREKMVFIMPKIEETSECRGVVPNYIRNDYNSFLSIIKSIYSIIMSYVRESNVVADRRCLISINKDKYESQKDAKINVKDINIESNILEEKHYSKEQLHVIEKDEKELLEFGTKVHEMLELIDFNNMEEINKISNSYIRNKIINFINSDLMKDLINNKMYKEYEFLYKSDGVINHGIIDLLVECDDYYVIVDYKLKNIDDINYDKQLNGYREYIEKKTGKKTLCYLYSIIDEKYREIVK